MRWIETLETYFEQIAPELQPEVRTFLDEYYEKKDTHSADLTTFGKLSDEELKEILYLDLNVDNIPPQKILLCENLKILSLGFTSNNLDFLADLPNLRILDIFGHNVTAHKKKLITPSKLFALSILSDKSVLNIFDIIIDEDSLLICYLESDNYNANIDLTNRLFPLNSRNLLYLHLLHQNIKETPDLSQFPNLIYLWLSYNQIEEIPRSIQNLRYLKYFFLTGNKIKYLPEEIFELPNLETLYFDNNQVDIVPSGIFNASNLKDVRFSNNPYEKMSNAKILSELIIDTDVGIENENDFLQLLEKLNESNLQADYNYVTLKIPKSLQTPMLQYFEFFKDYVETTKGKNIIFDVKRDKEGLVLVTNGNTATTLPEVSKYFEEYVSLTQQKSEDWIFNFEKPSTAMEADILRLKMENEIGRLKNAFQIAKLESQHLSNQLADRHAENQFLKQLSQSLSQKIDILISGKTVKTLHVDQLLLDIQDIAVRMLERKDSQQLENLHNDILTDFLRQKGYQAADQTRSGRSKLGVGEIDIMIRKKDGTPFSIIETFRLRSCGKDNKTVAEHIDKLLHNYDTAGHERNFIIVYAEAKRFEQLWNNYKKYVSEINGKPAFRAKYPLIKFEEKSEISTKSSIKIGLATHRREGAVVGIYHVFINMFA